MVIVEIKEGNVLDATEEYIAHQCNCITNNGKGLSEALFKRYPYADVYRNRQIASRPGTILLRRGNGASPTIIAMFAQLKPGKVKSEPREKWFVECLEKIVAEVGNHRVAMPYKIGCGLAGGNWDVYSNLLEETSLEIVLYKKD